MKGNNFFYSLEAQGIYNEAQFTVLSEIKQDTACGSLLRENQLAKMAKIESENREMLVSKRKKREKVERAHRHYLFTRCSKIFNAFHLLAKENGKCLQHADRQILTLREETMSKFLIAWRKLSSTFRASRKKTSALCNNVSIKSCRRVFVEWREITIITHRNTYTTLFLERWKYICVSRFRREENKRRANALRAKLLKRAWLKCWHCEYLIGKAARLVVQNEAAVKIQVLYRDYRTRSKTAQLLAQKKKALLAKFVYQGIAVVNERQALASNQPYAICAGQEFVADNPDGAHMRGLNANMIDSIENEYATGAHHAALHEHEPGQLMTENEYAETNVRRLVLLER